MIKAGFPVFTVASNSFVLWAVSTAAWTRYADAIVAPWKVHTHTVVPAGVCLQATLVDVWRSKEKALLDKSSHVV